MLYKMIIEDTIKYRIVSLCMLGTWIFTVSRRLVIHTFNRFADVSLVGILNTQ